MAWVASYAIKIPSALERGGSLRGTLVTRVVSDEYEPAQSTYWAKVDAVTP